MGDTGLEALVDRIGNIFSIWITLENKDKEPVMLGPPYKYHTFTFYTNLRFRISHNPKEFTPKSDLIDRINVLLEVAIALSEFNITTFIKTTLGDIEFNIWGKSPTCLI